MAALFRNGTSTQLSLITGALSRLQIRRPSVLIQHSTHSRNLSQTRSGFLKQQLGADLATTRDHDLLSTKNHANSSSDDILSKLTAIPLPKQGQREGRSIRASPRTGRDRVNWSVEEDKELYLLAKEGRDAFYSFEEHFRYRSLTSVSRRISDALKAVRIAERQAREGVRPGEIDVAKSAAGDNNERPLRSLYQDLRKADAKIRHADTKDDTVLRRHAVRKDQPLKGKWTLAEDELLEELVRKYIAVPQPTIWYKVSGGEVNDSVLLRDASSCRRRWAHLHPPPLLQRGHWAKEEERLLQEAISEQLGGKYQVAVDVLVGRPATREHSLARWRPELQQLPELSGLPILKLGSRRLRNLNWPEVQDKVKSREASDCLFHFYRVYHNADRGKWSKEENTRLQEGLERFGKDYWKIAEHIGTRSPYQVNLKTLWMETKGVKNGDTTAP